MEEVSRRGTEETRSAAEKNSVVQILNRTAIIFCRELWELTEQDMVIEIKNLFR